MLTKEQFATLRKDFVASQEFVQIAHDMDRTMDWVCHPNAYLVATFLERLGHECRWVSGYYQCNPPAPPVRHSWVEINVNDQRAIILEFDPRQLFNRGGYEDDLMPSGEIPEFGITFSPVATIVVPQLVELPSDEDDRRFVVASQEVMLRYVQDRMLAPEMDVERLDKLSEEAQSHYEDMLREREESEQE